MEFIISLVGIAVITALWCVFKYIEYLEDVKNG